MAISEIFTNSATIGTTEYSMPNASTTLTPQTTDYCAEVHVNLANMAGGDEYQFTIYEKVTSGGSQIVYYRVNLVGPQSPPVLVFPALLLMHGWDMTIKKIAGTDRSFAWSGRGVA